MGSPNNLKRAGILACRGLDPSADKKVSTNDEQDAHNKDRVVFSYHAIAHSKYAKNTDKDDERFLFPGIHEILTVLRLCPEKHIFPIIFQFFDRFYDIAHCRMGLLLLESRKRGVPSLNKLF